jgi:hypothetical protein
MLVDAPVRVLEAHRNDALGYGNSFQVEQLAHPFPRTRFHGFIGQLPHGWAEPVVGRVKTDHRQPNHAPRWIADDLQRDGIEHYGGSVREGRGTENGGERTPEEDGS